MYVKTQDIDLFCSLTSGVKITVYTTKDIYPAQPCYTASLHNYIYHEDTMKMKSKKHNISIIIFWWKNVYQSDIHVNSMIHLLFLCMYRLKTIFSKTNIAKL